MYTLKKSIRGLIGKMGTRFLAGPVAVGKGQCFKTRR